MLEIIPSLNCKDFACVKKRFDEMREFGNEWVHIDISDGKFNAVTTWNNPEELEELEVENWKLETHLMVVDPGKFIGNWLKAGAKRIIVHLESVKKIGEDKFQAMVEKISEAGAEVMLAINPDTPAEDLLPYLGYVFEVQFLAVPPGLSGQEFNGRILEKIKFLRERSGDIRLEVDGGITFETAKLVRRLGADAIVSGSYIFRNKNPLLAYETLAKVDNLLYEEER